MAKAKALLRNCLIVFLTAVFGLSLQGCTSANPVSQIQDVDMQAQEILQSNDRSDQIVVEYVGGNITMEEYERFLACTLFFYPAYDEEKDDAAYMENIVHQMVAMRYLSREISSDSKQKAEEKVSVTMQRVKQSLNNGDAAAQANREILSEYGITESDLQSFLLESTAVMIETGSRISDQQVKEQYEEYCVLYPESMVTVSGQRVFVPIDASDAYRIIQQAQNQLQLGADFYAVAEEYSQDPYTSAGGHFNDLELRNVYGSKLLQAYLETAPGDSSGIIEAPDGYYIIKIESREEKEFAYFADDIRGILAQDMVIAYINDKIPDVIIAQTLYEEIA